MNTNYTIPAFAEPITSLPDTPTCEAAELKRRFQAPADEVREAHNALAKCVEGITSATYPDTVTEDMLTEALANKINGKAEQADLTAAIDTLEAADAATQTQIAAKCEAYFGTYTGDGTENRVISLGFTPKAVLLLKADGRTYYDRHYYGGLAFTDNPVTVSISQSNYDVVKIVANGFQVTYYYHPNSSSGAESNASGETYFYLAFK
ncbi:MAG: hypothetical protein Q3Y08_10375 [Butyricicoccus sp.]|nr:hypothetical protein [Butyricicoccus sp.]